MPTDAIRVVTSLHLLVPDSNHALGLDDLDGRRVVHVTVYRIAIRFCTGMGAGRFELYYAIGAGPSTTGPLPCPPFTWQAAQDAALKSGRDRGARHRECPRAPHTVLNTDSPRASCADPAFPIDRERAEGPSDAKGLPGAAQTCSCAHNPASPTMPTPIALPSPLRTDSKPTTPTKQARWRTGRAGGRQHPDAIRYQTPSMWRTAVWR